MKNKILWEKIKHKKQTTRKEVKIFKLTKLCPAIFTTREEFEEQEKLFPCFGFFENQKKFRDFFGKRH